MRSTKSAESESIDQVMLRITNLKSAIIVGGLLLPAAAALADSDPNLVIPESSKILAEDLGMRAHTNHLIYVGPPLLRGEVIDPAELSPHGPFDFGMFTGVSGYHPADLRAAYELPSTGGSSAIAIVDAYHYATSLNDFNVFAAEFSLPKETSTSFTASSNKVFQVVYQGSTQPAANASWNQEEALDIEWAHSMAPSAKIYLVEANSTAFTDLFAAVQKAATLPGVKQISMSWGGSEFKGENTYDGTFDAAGIVYFAAAGDTAAEKSYPALSVNVVGVGGTTLKLTSADKLTSEVAWSDTGGGLSAYEAIPTYQKSIASIVGKFRGGPDVAFDADPNTGVAVYDSTKSGGYVGWMVFGGTSVASPCVAGVTNLSAHNYTSTAAELAHVYAGLGGSNFRDITSGSAGANKAKAGWDFCAGVGVPLGINAM